MHPVINSFPAIIILHPLTQETLPVAMYLTEISMQAPTTKAFLIQTLPGLPLKHSTLVLTLKRGKACLGLPLIISADTGMGF